MNKAEVIARLNDLNNQIDANPAGSLEYEKASLAMQKLVFGNVDIRDAHFIAQALGRPMTNKETAGMILAAKSGKPLNTVIQLPVDADAAYTIRYERKKAGMTQTDLANKIGLTQSQLAKIEGGQATISLEVLQRAMNVFGKPFVIQP